MKWLRYVNPLIGVGCALVALCLWFAVGSDSDLHEQWAAISGGFGLFALCMARIIHHEAGQGYYQD